MENNVKVRDYITDPEFLSAVAQWKEEKRCPFWLQDWLLDRGLDSAAEAAQWAYSRYTKYWKNGSPLYLIPDSTVYSRSLSLYYWWRGYMEYPDGIPESVFKSAYPNNSEHIDYCEESYPFEECIVHLLDNWTLGLIHTLGEHSGLPV